MLIPNSTNLCQPLDVAAFKGMKSKWAKILREWRLYHPTGAIPKQEFLTLLKELVGSVNKESLMKGFLVCGIVPLNKEQVLKRIPTLDSLVR